MGRACTKNMGSENLWDSNVLLRYIGLDFLFFSSTFVLIYFVTCTISFSLQLDYSDLLFIFHLSCLYLLFLTSTV